MAQHGWVSRAAWRSQHADHNVPQTGFQQLRATHQCRLHTNSGGNQINGGEAGKACGLASSAHHVARIAAHAAAGWHRHLRHSSAAMLPPASMTTEKMPKPTR